MGTKAKDQLFSMGNSEKLPPPSPPRSISHKMNSSSEFQINFGMLLFLILEGYLYSPFLPHGKMEKPERIKINPPQIFFF